MHAMLKGIILVNISTVHNYTVIHVSDGNFSLAVQIQNDKFIHVILDIV